MVFHPWTILLVVCTLITGVITKVSISPNTGNKSTKQLTVLSSTFQDTSVCWATIGLRRAQAELCKKQPDTTEIALQGLQQAVKECQRQFVNHRWNCSISTTSRYPHNSAIFQKGFKETAFLYAISSAGVTMSVARACSQGSILSCGCDPSKYHVKKERSQDFNFKWGGCSHNLQYGIRFSKQFLDSREKAPDIHSKINLHNNQVGRLAVKNNMQIKCKCHGVSGSCELKTCWRKVPDFKEIGKILKDRYYSAVLVDQSNLGNGKQKQKVRAPLNKKKKKKPQARLNTWITPGNRTKKKELVHNLLYYEKSPNYCEKDPSFDALGTIGRKCNRTSTAHDSCSSLCCGRGYNLQKIVRNERCNCKFIWCCTVKCDNCTVEEWVTVCN